MVNVSYKSRVSAPVGVEAGCVLVENTSRLAFGSGVGIVLIRKVGSLTQWKTAQAFRACGNRECSRRAFGELTDP